MRTHTRIQRPRDPAGLLLTGVILISFSPIFVTVADTAAVTVGFYRNFFGLFFLMPWVIKKARGKWVTDRISLLLPLLAGLVFFLDLTAWHQSIQYVGPGIATLLGNFQVFFVSLFGIFFLGERLSWQFGVSVPVALGGIYLIVGAGDISGSPDYGKGIILGLLTAFFYSLFLLILRSSQTRPNALSPEVNLAYLSFWAALFFGIAVWVTPAPLAIETGRSLWALLGYGLFTHCIGWIIISRTLPRMGASVAGILLLLQPVLSFVWEGIFFDKGFHAYQLFGAGLALAAIYLGMKGQQRNLPE